MNRIVQINNIFVLYRVIVIKIFDVKIVYAIYPRIYTLRHYGTNKCNNFKIKLNKKKAIAERT